MALNDNAAIYWLILATCISSVTSALLYLFQRCCGNCWGNIGNVCFQLFANSLDLKQETFYQVTNLFTFPRLFQQMELHTYKVVWNHDANAQTGDFIQYGWLRLPTKSYVLTLMAVCGVTHYVYIPFDLKSVEIVGPAHAIRTLVNMSNLAASAPLTFEQLAMLRQAFGMGNACTAADKVCLYWERRFGFLFMVVFSLWLAYALHLNLVIFVASWLCVILLTSVTCCMGNWKQHAFPTWRRRHDLISSPSRTTRTPSRETELAGVTSARTGESGSVETLQVTSRTEAGADALLTPGASTNVSSEAIRSHTIPVANVHSDEEANQPDQMIYSLLLPHGHYFEVVKQTLVTPQLNPFIYFTTQARMYAVKMKPNFVHYLAEHTFIQKDALLHICVYNPLIDPYLTEIYQIFQKGVKKENLLLIILPPLATFEDNLQTTNLQRARTATSTQFVGTLMDYESLLLQMTAGFLRKLTFVLPIDANTQSSSGDTWRTWISTKHVLGHDNCFWSDTT